MLIIALIGVLVPLTANGGVEFHRSTGPSAIRALLPPEQPILSACATGACLADAGTLQLQAKSLAATDPTAAATTDVTASPEPLPDPTAEPMPTMEVRAGDTLVALAAWFGVTPWDIAVANGRPVDDYLQIGEVLAIPVAFDVFVIPPDASVAALDETADLAAEPVTPAPQPTPVPPTPAPYIPPSSDAVIAAICSLPWDCATMIRIASCESGLNPRAYNPAGYYGLFQISEGIAGWDDPLINATYAYEHKYLPALAYGDGLSPWPVCRYY